MRVMDYLLLTFAVSIIKAIVEEVKVKIRIFLINGRNQDSIHTSRHRHANSKDHKVDVVKSTRVFEYWCQPSSIIERLHEESFAEIIRKVAC